MKALAYGLVVLSVCITYMCLIGIMAIADSQATAMFLLVAIFIVVPICVRFNSSPKSYAGLLLLFITIITYLAAIDLKFDILFTCATQIEVYYCDKPLLLYRQLVANTSLCQNTVFCWLAAKQLVHSYSGDLFQLQDEIKHQTWGFYEASKALLNPLQIVFCSLLIIGILLPVRLYITDKFLTKSNVSFVRWLTFPMTFITLIVVITFLWISLAPIVLLLTWWSILVTVTVFSTLLVLLLLVSIFKFEDNKPPAWIPSATGIVATAATMWLGTNIHLVIFERSVFYVAFLLLACVSDTTAWVVLWHYMVDRKHYRKPT